jgi:hypothetical protein
VATHEERKGQILGALRAMRWGRIEWEGGYPAVVVGDTIPGYVLVADCDSNDGPELVVYRWPDLFRWYEEALRWRVDNPGECLGFTEAERENETLPGIVTAMYETQPEGIELTDLRGKTY